jgi:ATP-dependent DNA helicase PIF1
MILNKDQQIAYDLIKSGSSVFITGGGGVGKSALLNYYIKNNKKKSLGVTSTTGTSAILINGTTLHSYLGLGTGKQTAEQIASNILSNFFLKKRWERLRILIIDEISMLSGEFFDKLETVARIVRYTDEPFGGIQLILSGDFCQLPPIESDKFCFEAVSWSKCVEKVIYLTEIIRQENKNFQNCLSNIRLGYVNDEIIEIINSRINVELNNDYGIKPTKLFSKNILVDETNLNELNILTQKNKKHQYKMSVNFKNNLAEKYKKLVPAVENLEICLGCQVMLIYNLDISNHLINGSRGIVTDFIYQDGNLLPKVKFLNGIEIVIDFNVWRIEENDEIIGTITQIPLKLAYAFSIHKAQGCSLDYAILDLSNLFDYGMAYVALSRVRNLEGLTITSINWKKVKANPKAIEFYSQVI